jgi:quercetin 2,3-dioxygenase
MNTDTITRAEAVTQARGIDRIVTGIPTSDGAGVKLTRVLTHDLQRRLDPFLMLDAFRSDNPDDYIAGFPDHPHRGFETVSYMLAGRLRHHDNAGHEGLLEAGGVQWMVAGRGIIHSELPEQDEGLMEGFQLWLNLPARDKMTAPWYRDIPSSEIPTFVTDAGVTVRVIAGNSHGVAGAVQREVTEPLYLDVHLPAGARFEQAVPAAFNAFAYVYRGSVRVGNSPRNVRQGEMAIFATGPDADGIAVSAQEATRLILVAGRPLGEPIAQYGPFVMNTQQEIFQAVEDFRAGRI